MNVLLWIRRSFYTILGISNRKPYGLSRRKAVKEAARRADEITHVPRVPPLDSVAFHAFAARGVPFLIGGIVRDWPLAGLTLDDVKLQFGSLRVRARTGDYVGTAFTSKRTMLDMSLTEYLALTQIESALPPYLGNQRLPGLNSLCLWPPYFQRCSQPRIWLGPPGTVTPLHCDYDDNLFAQIWGRKRFILFPPHHDEFLYTKKLNPVLFGSNFDPESPDLVDLPLASRAKSIECVVESGDLLFLPAGWFHHVRALDFSLSANLWTKDRPCALFGAA